MNIPPSFKAAQAAVFQDKAISLLVTVTTPGSLGGFYVSPGSVVSTHTCNVQFVQDKSVADEYGLTIGQDIIITGDALPIEKNDFIRYGDTVFRVVESPRYDAYTKLIAKRWS